MAHSFPKNKIKIVLTENIHDSAVERFEADGFKVHRIHSALGEDDLIKEASDAHILGIRSKTHVTRNFLEKADRLLSIGCFCIGTNQVELNEAKSQGVAVFNAPFSNTRSVAELILCEVVMLSRQIGDRNSELHRGEWKKSAKGCREIRGKTLGIIGYGHIGSQVSVLAEAFGMKVIYHDVVSKMPIGNSTPVSGLNELLENSDFVTLHVPATELTHMMISKTQLKRMKKGSYLLNLSRGSVVDIEALASFLEEGHLAGASVDVYPEEPEASKAEFKTKLQGLSNVILTPHIGGSTEEAQFNIGREVSAALINYVNEGTTIGSVNLPELEMRKREDSHRILNVHKNVPGVLANLNAIISEVGANIQGQQLSTDNDIGYLIMDVDHSMSDVVKEKIKALDTSIKTRILY
jgi:D-3-phosphoglycerate dehydrogenase